MRQNWIFHTFFFRSFEFICISQQLQFRIKWAICKLHIISAIDFGTSKILPPGIIGEQKLRCINVRSIAYEKGKKKKQKKKREEKMTEIHRYRFFVYECKFEASCLEGEFRENFHFTLYLCEYSGIFFKQQFRLCRRHLSIYCSQYTYLIDIRHHVERHFIALIKFAFTLLSNE